MRKRYIFVTLIIVIVCILIWKLSSSYALYNKGYEGTNIVNGDKWSVNVVEIGDVVTNGDATLLGDIDSIGTTFNFDVNLIKSGDSISFPITIKNTGKLDAMLYTIALSGLSKLDSEVINYEIVPLDYTYLKTDTTNGSIMKNGQVQMFKVTVSYSNNVSVNTNRDYNLNLSGTIIYQQV